jgi:hypothetical protein
MASPTPAAQNGDLETFLVATARLPGYTGFRPGVRGVNAKTPAMAELASATPRRAAAAPCSTAATTAAPAPHHPHHHHPPPLFPCLTAPGPQRSARPGTQAPGAMTGTATPPTTLASATSQSADAFSAPSPAFARLRSPMRNGEFEQASAAPASSFATIVAAASAAAAMRARYSSAHARVGGSAAVAAMVGRMRERVLAKLGGTGDNAFRLRALFRRYDVAGTGRVSLEDFRQMGEAFGLQLGDDALLALFSEWDGGDDGGTGTMAYEPFMRALLSADAFALFSPESGSALARLAGRREAAGAARAIAASARGGAAAVRRVLGAMAMAGDGGGGALPWAELCAGLATVGVALSPCQSEYVRGAFGVVVGGGGESAAAPAVDWRPFCDALDEAAA